MRFTVPNNPYKILKAARARLPAQSQKSPAWMNALAKFPPGPFPMRQVVPSEVGQFISPGAVERFAHDQELASRNPHRSKRPRMNPHPLAVSSKPPLIVYPEDKLRERFYSEHPFEMTRPKSVLETEEGLEGRKTMKESLNDNWTNVSGEDVVRRAQFLMTAEGGGHKEETAYNLALALFYRVRSEEERMAEVERFRKKEQLKRAAAVSGTTAETTGERQGPAVTSPNAPDESEDEHFEIKWFRERETEEIEEGVRFAKEVQSRIDQRQKVQSEVAQFEARNRSQAASAASGSPSKP
ncbi:mitochondrial ribosomal protein S25-domain-containing protein [Zopfochytrium polystomum]|nr:mitochondrial ribosomal protein S25-domain-containing protein [Zopfochytrium polystomum]